MSIRFHSQTPPVVLNLIIANIVVFVATTLLESDMVRYGLFNYDFREGAQGLWDTLINLRSSFDPTWSQAHFDLWQPFTYMFMHANFSHLFFNMFSLWMFGRTLEMEMGWKRFLTYYLVCGIGAGIVQMGVAQIDLSQMVVGSPAWQTYMQTPTVGASGAIFGLLLAFGMLHPNAIISLIIPPVSLKAKWFVIIYGVLELFLGVWGTMSDVAHFAHLGGMIWGLILLLWWRHRDRNRYIYY